MRFESRAPAGVASRNYAVPSGIWEYDPFTGFYSPVEYSIDRDWGSPAARAAAWT
jgi:hypothetical protein